MRRIVAGLRQAQERSERTLFGQGVISALILVVLATGVIWCLPDSVLKQRLRPAVTPVALGLGLDQYWGVFAPNPPRQVDTISVVVTRSDGREIVWNIPHGDPLVGQYSWYHWQKIKENLLRTPSLRSPFARWVAGQVAPGSAAKVRMIRHTVTLPPPGSSAQSRTSETVIYSAVLARS